MLIKLIDCIKKNDGEKAKMKNGNKNKRKEGRKEQTNKRAIIENCCEPTRTIALCASTYTFPRICEHKNVYVYLMISRTACYFDE